MTYEELRYIISTFPKYPGTEIIAPAPIIHEGFPGNFNMSFTEYEMIVKGSGQMLDPHHDYIFSKIQPCIRFNDFLSLDGGEWTGRHLALFDMADVGGLIYLKDKASEQENLARHSVQSMCAFLIDTMGFDPKKLKISYFPGGLVSDATAGKYTFERYISPDPTLKYWFECGLHHDNFMPEISRNTFLALNVYGSPTPWGYRNEIHIEHKGQLWDIGTIENCAFRPLFNGSREISGITNFNHAVSAGAVGLERILIIKNDLESVNELPKIQNLTQVVKKYSKTNDPHAEFIIVEGLRCLNIIFSTCDLFLNLSDRRKEKFKKILSVVKENCFKIGMSIDECFLSDFLNCIALNYKFTPNLNVNRENKIFEIMAVLERAKIPALNIEKTNDINLRILTKIKNIGLDTARIEERLGLKITHYNKVKLVDKVDLSTKTKPELAPTKVQNLIEIVPPLIRPQSLQLLAK